MSRPTATFAGPYQQYAARHGQRVEILGPPPSAEVDEELRGQSILVRFPDGFVTAAWREELEAVRL